MDRGTSLEGGHMGWVGDLAHAAGQEAPGTGSSRWVSWAICTPRLVLSADGRFPSHLSCPWPEIHDHQARQQRSLAGSQIPWGGRLGGLGGEQRGLHMQTSESQGMTFLTTQLLRWVSREPACVRTVSPHCRLQGEGTESLHVSSFSQEDRGDEPTSPCFHVPDSDFLIRIIPCRLPSCLLIFLSNTHTPLSFTNSKYKLIASNHLEQGQSVI